ncbi:galactokinase [Myxococcota bacterium]|nr:galactokinase [Myxococcota bacterium]
MSHLPGGEGSAKRVKGVGLKVSPVTETKQVGVRPSQGIKMAAAAAEFRDRTGLSPEVVACAPGRVNLIGEHTDYTHGLVLPCAIDQATIVVAKRRPDRRVIAHALDLNDRAEFAVDDLQLQASWIDYLQGIAFALREQGIELPGLELSISSAVPQGAGLSSSAALGVAVCAAWLKAQGEARDNPRRWAEIAHRGENHFVGVGCGILDQFASALSEPGHALRIDCRTREAQPVAFAKETPALLIAHSGVTRSLAADGAYRQRVEECAEAWAAIQRAKVFSSAVEGFRDLSIDDLPTLEGLLVPPLNRRVRHIVTENHRVDQFCAAMRAKDWASLGGLMAQGQASLRDDYEVSIPELDALCEIADEIPGVIGSRLTGAGFGGCTVHLVQPQHREAVEPALKAAFQRRFGRVPRLIQTGIGGGAECQVL